MFCLGTESFLRAEMLDTYYYTLYDGQDKDFPEDYDSKPIEEILQEIEGSVGQTYPDYYRLEKFDFSEYGYWFEPYVEDGHIRMSDFSAKLDANRAKMGTQKIKMVQSWLKDDKEAETFEAKGDCKECYGTGGLYDSHMGINDECHFCGGTGFEY